MKLVTMMGHGMQGVDLSEKCLSEPDSRQEKISGVESMELLGRGCRSWEVQITMFEVKYRIERKNLMHNEVVEIEFVSENVHGHWNCLSKC